MTMPAETETVARALAALHADPAFAAQLAAGAPVLAAATAPLRAVFASPAARSLFGSGDLAALTDRLLNAGERLAALAAQMPAGGPARLERARMALGGTSETLTLACRAFADARGVRLFVMTATGVRPALLRREVPAAPPAAPDPPAREPSAPPAAVEAAAPEPPLPPVAPQAPVAAAAPSAPPRPVRFTWRSGAEGALAEIAPAFLQALRLQPGDVEGLDFAALADRFGFDGDGPLQEAMARKATFSGIETLWRVAEIGSRVPVTLGGTPMAESGRLFGGFKGFGTLHLNRAEPWRPGPADEEAANGDTEADPEASDFAPPPEAAAPRVPERAAPAAEQRQVAAPPASDPPPVEPDPAFASPELRDRDPAGLQQALRDSVAGGHAEPDGEPPQSEPRAPEERNVVRLRQLQLVPKIPPAETGALSAAERSNFREIGLSLGVAMLQAPAEHLPPAANDVHRVAIAPPDNAAIVLERLPVGVLAIRDGATLYINRTLLDLLGYADAAAFAQVGGLGRMFKGRDPQEFANAGGAVPVVALDGAVHMVDARVQMLDWSGAPATLITFRRAIESDLAPRLAAAELDLRHAEGETREAHAILDTATDGVAVLDESGRILSLNRSGEALFGYDKNEVAGEPFSMLIARESQPAAQDYFDGLRHNGVATVLNDGREVLGRARKGGAIPMFMTLGRLGTGETPKFCAVLRDLTQWKKAERELGDARREAEKASALKSEFLAKISHEIRTPLNAILGFTEVIMEERFGPVGNERYKDYLKDIHASGAHVMSLVNDLLDLSKIEAGKMEMDFSSVDANRIVSESVSLMHPAAARERVVIRQSLAPRLPNVVADERALRQIVLNLVSNAIKFNTAGGQVIVSTALTDAGHAVIRFRDTGIGMSDAEVEMAMEPFRQLETSGKAGGTGLGLPLTKALVEANRASFSIKSKKHEGTLVEVAFPPTRVLAE